MPYEGQRCDHFYEQELHGFVLFTPCKSNSSARRSGKRKGLDYFLMVPPNCIDAVLDCAATFPPNTYLYSLFH